MTKYCIDCGIEIEGKRKRLCDDCRIAHKKAGYRTKEEEREYYLANRDRIIERSHAYYWSNRDKISQRARAYRQAHAEEIRIKKLEYAEKTREHKRAKDKLDRKLRPDYYAAKDRATKSRRRGADGYFSGHHWSLLVRHYSPDGKCLCCGKVSVLTADHVVPLICGGTNYISNIQPLCRKCNRDKWVDSIDYRNDGGLFAKALSGLHVPDYKSDRRNYWRFSHKYIDFEWPVEVGYLTGAITPTESERSSMSVYMDFPAPEAK